ncbi:MAG TPA: DUF4976 domain-containing protein [Bacteroides sp.]|nr:DUF4976 domain-containing protein [Bacteroides sp.]
MKTICLIPIALVFAVLLPACVNSDSAETVSPNIIYVLTDQWRAQSTGYNGDPNLIGKTPNIDLLAAQGVNFKNAISVCPVCTPYRAALLTGQYPTTTGMFMNDLHLPEESVTMAELFKEAGYQTCYIGKWHLDGMGRFEFTPPERRQGFEYWKALECSHNYNNLHYYTGDSDEKKYWEGYAPYAETDEAISYIRENAGGDKPFLMVLAWGTPHFPHHTAPEELQKNFSPDNIILRKNVNEEMKERAKKESVGYYAHILALDSCMGKLQNALEQAGISENTILVFTSDHGEMMGSQGVRPKQKQVPWAESVKVPFLLRYPARFGNKKMVVDAPINTPDILPTLLTLAGLPVHDAIEGEDMSRAIENKEEAADKAALIMSVSPFAGKADEYRGIYTSRYAYVKTLEGPWFLFDHEKDPLQLDNLLGKPGYEELQKDMERMLNRELARAGDEFLPREYYIDKWGYRLTEGGYIDYSAGAEFQGPGLNKSGQD